MDCGQNSDNLFKCFHARLQRQPVAVWHPFLSRILTVVGLRCQMQQEKLELSTVGIGNWLLWRQQGGFWDILRFGFTSQHREIAVPPGSCHNTLNTQWIWYKSAILPSYFTTTFKAILSVLRASPIIAGETKADCCTECDVTDTNRKSTLSTTPREKHKDNSPDKSVSCIQTCCKDTNQCFVYFNIFCLCTDISLFV